MKHRFHNEIYYGLCHLEVEMIDFRVGGLGFQCHEHCTNGQCILHTYVYPHRGAKVGTNAIWGY